MRLAKNSNDQTEGFNFITNRYGENQSHDSSVVKSIGDGSISVWKRLSSKSIVGSGAKEKRGYLNRSMDDCSNH